MSRLPAPLALFLLALALAAPRMLHDPRPSAAAWDRGPAASLRFWQWQPHWSGGSPAWAAGDPLVPALVAAVASTGLSAERAELLVMGIASAVSPVLVFYLARWLALPAGWTALAFCLAPNRSVLELAIALVAGYVAAHRRRLFPIAACVTVFAAGLGWERLFARRDAPPAVEAATLAWLERHAPGKSALGELSLGKPAPQTAFNPIRRQAEDLILRPSGVPVRYSLLWLEALGASHLVSASSGQYGAALEAEYEDRAGYRVYEISVARPAPAVLVSRYQWRGLPRFRSLYDRAALLAYVNWANRPEAAGLRWTAPGTAEIRADLGPDDMILVRQNAASGWTATLDGRPLECLHDPIGFLLLDPQRTGLVNMVLSAPRWLARSAVSPLPARALPAINPGGIIDGIRHTPPPFGPGTVITIYGTDLAFAGPTRVLAAGRPAEVLYAGDLQVNARLPNDLHPGPTPIEVEAGGSRSDPVTIEIQ